MIKNILIGVGVITTLIVLYVIGYGIEVASTARAEVAPKAILKKYEWFKNAKSSLDEKQANLVSYKARCEEAKTIQNPDRTDKENASLACTEYLGMKASYNSLVSEYNAQSSKINWAFAQGDIPQHVEEFQ